MTKPEYHIASFSGGKDSTAMVLRMIERGDPLDEVMFCDTTMEYPAMLRHVEKVKQVIEAAGIKFTTLRDEHGFEWRLYQKPVKRKSTHDLYGRPGYGWPTASSRWCTRHLKMEPIERHLRELHQKYKVIQFIGIAADEDYRLERENNQDPNHRHPLREWGWTEADAMQYCRDKGYDWEGLYDLFPRVSCWCCPLNRYEILRNQRKHFPDLWARLLELDEKQCKSFFSHGHRVADFDRRFALEDVLTEAGQSIKDRRFFADLKRLQAGEVTLEEILQERTTEEWMQ